MNRIFGMQVKLAMSEQEKSIKRMAEEEQDKIVAEQQRRIEAFERTQGLGRQDYEVNEILGGSMEGKAKQLKVNGGSSE